MHGLVKSQNSGVSHVFEWRPNEIDSLCSPWPTYGRQWSNGCLQMAIWVRRQMEHWWQPISEWTAKRRQRWISRQCDQNSRRNGSHRGAEEHRHFTQQINSRRLAQSTQSLQWRILSGNENGIGASVRANTTEKLSYAHTVIGQNYWYNHPQEWTNWQVQRHSWKRMQLTKSSKNHTTTTTPTNPTDTQPRLKDGQV